MANQEQLEILKQGVEVWNKWRRENLDIQINLIRAHLIDANLIGVNLSEAQLSGAKLNRAHLNGALFNRAYLGGAHLHGAHLVGANFLRGDLNSADLSDADLSDAHLSNVNLREADLRRANLGEARLGDTNVSNVDLSTTFGLEDVKHMGPSTIGTDTLQISHGMIPEKFLKGCGLSDWEIEAAKLYDPDLNNEGINRIIYKIFDIRARQSIQISPLFISYSHADTSYVEKLEPAFTKLGIRFWRDVHNATSGRLEKQIDDAMRQNPTVILILSINSTKSDWVEHEARLARELEKELGRDVLCPVALDDSWKTANWPARLMEQIKEYNILDFSDWKDDIKFENIFDKLIDGLELFYK